MMVVVVMMMMMMMMRPIENDSVGYSNSKAQTTFSGSSHSDGTEKQ